MGTAFQLVMEFGSSVFGCELERNTGLILLCTHYQRFLSVCFDNTRTDVSLSVLILRNLGLFSLFCFDLLFPLSSAKLGGSVSYVVQCNMFK